ncbi:17035_t:CDS:10, partial [Dentiscutata erythropus]
QCQPALLIMQNVGNVTPEQNTPQTENHIPKNDKEWYDLMEIDNKKDSEPSDSEYDTAEEEPDIHFEKIKDPYINRIAEARKFNEGEGEPLAFFESIEEKIADIYKKELALKGELKHETIEIIREDRINATIEKGYNEIIDQIEDEALQESGYYLYLPEALDKPQLGLINPQNRDDNESTLHDIDKFKEINQNYAINIFRPVFSEAFGKIKVDIDPLYILERNYQVEHMIDLLYLTEDLLEKHIPTCPEPNKAPQQLILPEEAEQKAVSYGYTIHCSDRTIQKPVINRKSENIIKDLIKNLQEDLDVILDKLCIPVPCKLHEARYNKICIFDPETKKYLGVGHRKCHGKKLMIQGKLDDEQKKAHGACKKSKVTDEKIVPIANNSKQYITFSVGQLQFIDSMKFSLPGLAKMAENLQDEKKGKNKTPEQLAKCFPIMSKFISLYLLSLLTRKGIFPYQWLNNKTKFNKTQLPLCKDFNSDLDGFNYCDHNCRIEKYKHGEKIGKCKHKCQKCKHKKEPVKNLLEDQWIINEGKHVLKNTKVIDKWKDENGGDRAIGYAEVCAKCYSVICENSRKNMIKAKGLKKALIKRELTHKIFENCVLEGKEDQP